MTTIDVEGEEVDHVGAQPQSTAALEVVPVPVGALTRPIATVDQTRQAFEEYQKLRDTIIVAADLQRAGSKEFVTKSGWRKLAVVMGVSCELASRDYQRDGQGRIISAEVVIRAIAPNGRFQDGLGVCDVHERCCPRAFDREGQERPSPCSNSARSHTHCQPGCDGFLHFSKPQHDLPATAATRAQNRACSDLFGFGEVSAEEITDREEPIDETDAESLVAAMNSIADEGQRKGVKRSFAERFGHPNTLKKGQLDGARRFVTSAGGQFGVTPPPADPPAGVDRETGEVAPRCSCPVDDADGFVDPDCPLHGSAASPPVTASESTPRPPDPPAAPQVPPDPPSAPVEPVTPLTDAELDADVLEARRALEASISAEVAALTTVALTDALRHAGLSVGGNPGMRRGRLVEWRFQEAMTADVI